MVDLVVYSRMTWDQIKTLPGDEAVIYSTVTKWWGLKRTCMALSRIDSGVVCDPGGNSLEEISLARFLHRARKAVADGQYGNHGIKTLMLAYHGNLLTAQGQPAAFSTWIEYDQMLDQFEASLAKIETESHWAVASTAIQILASRGEKEALRQLQITIASLL